MPGSTRRATARTSSPRDFKELGIGYLSNQAFQGYAGAVLWSQQFGVRTAARSTASVPQATALKHKPEAHKKQPRRRRS